MKSQIELLKEDLARMEMRRGKDAPFVQALKRQLSSLESRQKGARPNPVTLHVGTKAS